LRDVTAHGNRVFTHVTAEVDQVNPKTRDRWLRAGLLVLAVTTLVDGLWARLAPHSFWSGFPTADTHWVKTLGPYDGHLITDLGGLWLGMGVTLLAAAIVLERRLVAVVAGGAAVFGISHFTYHLSTLDSYSTADNVASMTGLALNVVLPLGILLLVRRPALAPAGAGRAPDTGNARIVSAPERGLMRRYVYRATRKRLGKVATPVGVMAHHPHVLTGYGMLELATERSHRVPERYKAIAALKTAMLAGCEFCIDIGSAISRRSGLTDDELRDLVRYRDSDRLSELDKLVLEYAEGMSRTPVEVSAELFDRLRAHFDEAQLVELTNEIALENYRARFNWAFGIGSDGFSEGAYCVPAQPPAAAVPA
jgi:AhpD family alkylhydroperoxidase